MMHGNSNIKKNAMTVLRGAQIFERMSPPLEIFGARRMTCIIRCRIICLPLCYPKIERFSYREP